MVRTLILSAGVRGKQSGACGKLLRWRPPRRRGYMTMSKQPAQSAGVLLECSSLDHWWSSSTILQCIRDD